MGQMKHHVYSWLEDHVDQWFPALLILAVVLVVGILLVTQVLFPLSLHVPDSIAHTTGVVIGSLLVVLTIAAGIWLARGSDSLSDLFDAYPENAAENGHGIGSPRSGIWLTRRVR
jgi:protein-S-isoprenylcysteine O-methyltransferase Ste14